MVTESITYTCDMFGCSIKQLEESLTRRTVEAGKESVTKPLPVAQVWQILIVKLNYRYNTGYICQRCPSEGHL